MDESVRPILDDVLQQNTNPIETFQNTVLRPILKQKAEVLSNVLENQLFKIKFDFKNHNNKQIRSKIKSIFDNDHRFKQFLIGFVIGNFTITEFDFYISNQSELNKRILSLLLQRLLSNYK